MAILQDFGAERPRGNKSYSQPYQVVFFKVLTAISGFVMGREILKSLERVTLYYADMFKNKISCETHLAP